MDLAALSDDEMWAVCKILENELRSPIIDFHDYSARCDAWVAEANRRGFELNGGIDLSVDDPFDWPEWTPFDPSTITVEELSSITDEEFWSVSTYLSEQFAKPVGSIDEPRIRNLYEAFSVEFGRRGLKVDLGSDEAVL